MPIPHLKTPRNLGPNQGRSRPTGKFVKKSLRQTRGFFHRLLTRLLQKTRLSKQARQKISSILSGALLIGLLLVVVGGISSAIIFAWISASLGDPAKILDRAQVQSTKIYDRTGEVMLYEVSGDEKRTVVSLEDIPDHVQKATIAIEDKQFYTHKGYSLKGIIKAVCHQAFGNLGGLCPKRGGSTITQQLIKNSILTSERTYTRKIKELVLAYQMEKKLSKDEILGMYFNEIAYGNTAYGIESASQQFFSKSVKDLDLAEASLIAALPQAPTKLSPYGNHTDDLENRRKHILQLMADQGYITEEQADAAKAVDIISRVQPRRDKITAPHFVIYIRELLSEKYGETLLNKRGLRVISSLDLEKQEIAEQAITDGIEHIEKNGGSNAALVSLDPKTGEVLAMVGSRDYFDSEQDGQVNVTLRPRQPGSSFKPVVYAAGFVKGYTPETVLFDVNTTFKTDARDYKPKNYDLSQSGPLTVRTALQRSLNTPAVKMLYLTGKDSVLDLADNMGYSTLKDRSRYGLALVLGGGEIKLLEHASAFGSFANDGVHQSPVAILRVEDGTGRVLEEYKPGKGTKVFDAEIARQISDILKGTSIQIPGRPVAAKTGTTNDFRDAWTVGYTPSLVAGVWVGNNDNSEMARGASGYRIASPIFRQYMSEALKGTDAEGFQAPASVGGGRPVLNGILIPKQDVMIDTISGLLATSSTPERFIETKQFAKIHNILYWVNKDDPRGAPPSDPGADPQFVSWEGAVRAWAEKQEEVEIEEPPTEFDNVHTEENQPRVTLLSPGNNEVLNDRRFEISISYEAPRGARRVEVWIDEDLIDSSSRAPFIGPYTIPNRIGKGFHTLEVRLFDDIDNVGTASHTINLTADMAPLGAYWGSPLSGQHLSSEAFPLTLSATLTDATDVQQIEFFSTNTSSGDTTSLGTVTGPGKQRIVIHWNQPANGEYRLWIRATMNNGSSVEVSDDRSVTVE